MEPRWNVVISTMGVMVLVGISPLLLRRGVSFFVVGNWLAFYVFWQMLFVGALAGYGPPPFYWLAVAPMLALVIAGFRSALFWLIASLISLEVYYQHLYTTGSEGLVLSSGEQLIFEASVLAGLYLLVILMSLSYERAKNLAITELKVSEEWGRKIVEKAADAIVTIDADGIIYSANQACAEIFVYDEKDLRGRNFKDLVPALAHLPPAAPQTHEDVTVTAATHDRKARDIDQRMATLAWADKPVKRRECAVIKSPCPWRWPSIPSPFAKKSVLWSSCAT